VGVNDEIYEHTAQALARMELPDLSAFNPRDVHCVLGGVPGFRP
jgi:hypothetical protein